jgi:hypothetical protein
VESPAVSDLTPEQIISVAQRAKKNYSLILDGLRVVGQKTVAELIGESETTVSRAKTGELERCASILAAIGLKVIPVSHKSYSEDRIRALNVLARIGLDAETGSEWGVLGD